MCGIAAIIDYAKIEPKVEDIKSMTDLLAHRGPDGEGIYITSGVALGHRRLAIIDTAHRSDQPMNRSHLHLVFNGMIYNYVEIREELIALGESFLTESDTEVIIVAYETWGIEAFQKFNGMWAIILYDEQENKIIASRDRFGIKPLYYTTINNKIYFASEIKAFTIIEGWKPKINHPRLLEYLAFNMTDHTNETMFDKVYQLPKSHHAIIHLTTQKMSIVRYYDIKNNKPNDGSEFSELLSNAIKIRTRTDVPLATTLSGGLDSSSIVALMAHKINLKPETFTLAYPNHKLDESQYALLVNEKYNIPYKLISTTEEYLKKHIDNLVYSQDEPFTGATVMAQSNIYENIQLKGYKVVLGGQGGDEILCGYDKFSIGYFKEKVKRNPIQALKELYHFQKLKSFGIVDAIQSIIFYERNKKKKDISWYPLTTNQTTKRYVRNKENNIFEMSYNLLFGLGLSALLRYEDRNSMSYGVESRLPFMDYRLVEYCLNMSSDLKLKKGITKTILRETMNGIVPEGIINRKDKMGFVTPQNEWMNDNKDFYLKLASEALDNMPFVNREELEVKINIDNNLLWRVINTGKWINKFKVSA